MKTKGILSYLYYQDGEVLIDELSPKERLGEFLNNETKFYSMSMGKSVTSYLVGHAICEGYIDGVDARVNDWPIIKDSLYHDQKLINQYLRQGDVDSAIDVADKNQEMVENLINLPK